MGFSTVKLNLVPREGYIKKDIAEAWCWEWRCAECKTIFGGYESSSELAEKVVKHVLIEHKYDGPTSVFYRKDQTLPSCDAKMDFYLDEKHYIVKCGDADRFHIPTTGRIHSAKFTEPGQRERSIHWR